MARDDSGSEVPNFNGGQPQPGSPPQASMVVIGETGSGKTSFVQLLLNYANQYGEESFRMDRIKSFVHTEPSLNKRKEIWESDTTISKKYLAKFDKFSLQIIDTPGFCDTRGGEQDEANIANIIDIVKKEHYINCVCLIINGSHARLTKVLDQFLTQIVSIFPPDVLRNTIVVFTKVRDSLSLKFDVNLLEKFQLSIPDKYIFTIDNPYSRYERLPPTPKKGQITGLERDFADSHETLEEIFEIVQIATQPD